MWGRAVETQADTVALPATSAAATTTAGALEGTAPIEPAASTEHTKRPESGPHTTRRTRATARTGGSTSGATAAAAAPSATAAPEAAPRESSRSASRRARTTALEVAPVTPKVVAVAHPVRPAVAPEPVMELRQVITTAPITLPEPAALPATPSIAAVPVVEAPKRTRIRPTVAEPASTRVPAPAAPVAAAEPVIAAPAAASVTAAPIIVEPFIPAVSPRAEQPQPAPRAEQPQPAPRAERPQPAPRAEQPQPAPRAEQPQREQPHSAPKAEPVVDEFEAAARLFSFTGETPVQQPAAEPTAEPEDAAPHKAPRRPRNGVRRVATASFSLGVMGVVGLLAVGMTTPAEAVAAATGTASNPTVSVVAGDVQASDSDGIQTYVASSQAQTASLDDRAINYSSITAAQAGADSGVKNVSSAFFTNDPNSKIQWPFAVGCTISWGFGWRPGEFHEGVDFTPGAGAHVQAIADGVVRVSTDSGGGYGVMIIIDHIIDGKLVSSRYGHMQYGSRQVQVGDHVKVGQYIGRTGNTGRSYGAHTHLEILLNGVTPIDPLPWLRAHVT